MQRTLAISCLILVLLQCYRRHFFLADDNLIYWLPLVNGIGVRLAHGQSPFVDPHLFGGLRLLADPTSISLWNPLVLGLSLLANTRFFLWTVDLFASVNLLVSAGAFALLLERVRQQKLADLSANRIAFLSLSYTFSSYALSIGGCWLMFLANQASLPMIGMGFLATSRKNGVAWLTFGLLYALLVGHLSPFLYATFFLSILAVGMGWANRSREPLIRWSMALLIALLIAAPLLFPAALGYLESGRNASFSLDVAAQSSLPFSALIFAYFGGYAGVLLGSSGGLFTRTLIFGLASCLANLQFFAGLKKSRPLTRLEIVIGVLALLVALFMARPLWLGEIISHVPLFRSLRWPFRELYLFLFLAHLWLALRPLTLSAPAMRITTLLSVAVFGFSLALVPPWNFSPMEIDRRLIFSGQAHAYWERVKPLIGKNNQILVAVSPRLTKYHDKEIPYSLLGALNYPALFGVASISGYTAQGFDTYQMAEEVPYFFGGIYRPEVGAKMIAKDRHLRMIQLISLQPLRIDLCSAKGCQTLPTPPLQNR